METYPQQWLHQAPCGCQLCQMKKQSIKINQDSDLGKPNQMAEFLTILPIGFPLWIELTVLFNLQQGKDFLYGNAIIQEKGSQFPVIQRYQLKNITSLQTANLHLFWKNRQKIVPKFQASSHFAQKPSYIQPYQHRPIIRTQYKGSPGLLDNILIEYLQNESQQFKERYRLKYQFLEWVFRDYGEEIFFYFLTDLYVRYYFHLRGGKIKKGIFFWAMDGQEKSMKIVQKPANHKDAYNNMLKLGRPRKLPFKPRLINVKQLQVEHQLKLFSFKDEYQQIIKNKIAQSPKKTITAIKNPMYKQRLQKFKEKIQGVYQNEQSSIIQGIKAQRKFDFQIDTELMAQKLIPNMAPYKNLTQILSDQKAFRTVFKDKIRPLVTPSPIKKPSKMHNLSTTLSKYSSNIDISKVTSKNQKQKPYPMVLHRRRRMLTTPSNT